MKRLICSAAVASALLAATAIPSGAAVLNISGVSSEAGTPYDDTYSFRLPTTETVDVAGGEMNIASFTLTGLPISYTFNPSTLPTGFNSLYSFDGSATLGPGNYSLVVTGTGRGDDFSRKFFFLRWRDYDQRCHQPSANSRNIGTFPEWLGFARFLGLDQRMEVRIGIGFAGSHGLMRKLFYAVHENERPLH